MYGCYKEPGNPETAPDILIAALIRLKLGDDAFDLIQPFGTYSTPVEKVLVLFA
ncbi:hypothetical protein [Desulfoferrobacter suflitae]|uniref:hypothetical protein n=1 Tax=Desulfoferrobacter suflitae TaxID=2865782 RepID=UPI002164EA25|nr:hypothetical protein [Desulfoferrobacter suflitae]MCK8603132.1 hypothetical protein [Desulfoferrobacter suflitae]